MPPPPVSPGTAPAGWPPVQPAPPPERGEDGGFLYRSTVDAVMDTGYLEDCYLEGASSGVLIPNADALNIVEVDGARFIGADHMNAGLRFLFRSTSDGEVFFSDRDGRSPAPR